MNKEKGNKETKKEKTPEIKNDIENISDQDLEQAAGGFTLIDTCKKHYDRGTCYALDGLLKCPRLSFTKTFVREDSNGTQFYLFTMTCSKGIFAGVTDQMEFYPAY